MKATAYVHLYVPYHNAGGETTLHDILRAMVADGWEVDVILSRTMPGYEEPYTIDGVTVYPYTDKKQLTNAANKSQLLITHLENSERASAVSRTYRVPVAHIVHNDMDITKGYLAVGCDLAVFNTWWVRDSFVHPSSTYAGPKIVVHPRIDLERYKPTRTKKEYITLVNLWKGGPRGNDGKGSDIFYEMAQRFPNEKFLGVIGGYGEQDIRQLPNVTIQEHTPDIVQDVYSKTKLILMPSRYESFGRVAIEAAAMGIPTIANPTPGLKEALGPLGNYAPVETPDLWEEKINWLLNTKNYRAASRNAKDRAQYWADLQPGELETYLAAVRLLGERCLMLRGW